MKKEKYSLVGVDGNAYCIMAYVIQAMRDCKKTKEEQNEYLANAKMSDYNNLISVSSDMIEKLNKELENDNNKGSN